MIREKKAEIERFRARWSQDRANAVNIALRNGTLADLQMDTVEIAGHIYRDLRGFSLNGIFRGVEFSNVDLSYCIPVMAGQILDSKMHHCRFVGADLDTNFGNECHSSDFSRAKMGTLFGRFVECVFRTSKFRGAEGVGLQFIRCDFSGANFQSAFLPESTFDHCNWEGCKFGFTSFGGATFIGTRPQIDDDVNNLLDNVVYREQAVIARRRNSPKRRTPERK